MRTEAGQRLESILFELTVYRQGRTSVRFCFDRGLLIWHESTRWTRNFTRSFPKKAQERVLQALRHYVLSSWQPFYPTQAEVQARGEYHSLWHLELKQGEESCEFWGKDVFPPSYAYFVEVVEEICHEHFQVTEYE